tara:strand:- start:200 stop:367 length:168 start_codon:yes stop_codon:yes gene_type:complete
MKSQEQPFVIYKVAQRNWVEAFFFKVSGNWQEDNLDVIASFFSSAISTACVRPAT